MKNGIALFLITVIIWGCKPKNRHLISHKLIGDTVDVRYEIYDSSGNLAELYHEKDSLLHGVQEKYYPSGQIKMNGLWYKGQRVGWFRYYYHNGSLQVLRQYIAVDEPENRNKKTYLNQVIRFNEATDTVKSGAFFMRLNTTGDTIKNGTPYTFNIVLATPLFKEMLVILCDFDAKYSLLPNAICDTFGVENFQRSFTPLQYKLGENVIRGKVVNFENYLDSTGASRQHIATIYFEDKFFVKP